MPPRMPTQMSVSEEGSDGEADGANSENDEGADSAAEEQDSDAADEDSDVVGPVSPSSSRSGGSFMPSSAPLSGMLNSSLGGGSRSSVHSTLLLDTRRLKTLRFHVYHAAEGNNEDLSAQVLLGRVECSLREVLLAPNGELTRALVMSTEFPGMAGLSGFLHVMFHERRVVRVANTPRYAYRSYIFRDVMGADMVCHEALQESPLTWSMPHAALLRAVDHARTMRKQLMSALSEVDAELARSGGGNTGMISGAGSSTEEETMACMLKRQLSSFLQRQVKSFTAVIAQWEKLVRLHCNYAGVYRGLRFKPSVEKSNRALAFVAVNCHVQSFAVTRTGRNRTRPEPLLPSAAFSSPALGALPAPGSGGSGGVHSPAVPRSTPLLTSSRSVQLSSPGMGSAGVGVGGGAIMGDGAGAGIGGGMGSGGGVAPVEATSFVFEAEDFLSELRNRAAALKKASTSPGNSNVPASPATSSATAQQASGEDSPTPPPPPAVPSDAAPELSLPPASAPNTPASQAQPSRSVPASPALGPLAAQKLQLLRTGSFHARGLSCRMAQPASAQTKAVAQMIANSHAMAAASYGGPAVNALPNVPAFLSLGPSAASGAEGSGGSDAATSADSGGGSEKKKKEPKLLFTADGDAQQLVAYVPSSASGAGGGAASLASLASGLEGSSLEKARLVRRVPPRSPLDRTPSCHNYVTTTCGAFSAHSMGFKQGGVTGGEMKLLTKLYDLLGKHAAECVAMKTKPFALANAEDSSTASGGSSADSASSLSAPSPISISGNSSLSASAAALLSSSAASAASLARLVHPLLESGQRVLAQQWENQQRAHMVLSQAMTALTTSFVAHLLSSLTNAEAWARIARIGYLQQVESLLSTFHSELHMLQDMCFAARALEHVKFTIVQQLEERQADPRVFPSATSAGQKGESHQQQPPPNVPAGSMSMALPAFGSAVAAPPPPPPLPPPVPAPSGAADEDDDERSGTPSPPPPPPPQVDGAGPIRVVPALPVPAAAAPQAKRAVPPPPPPMQTLRLPDSATGSGGSSATDASPPPRSASPASMVSSTSSASPSASSLGFRASGGGAHGLGGLNISTSPAALVPLSPRGVTGGAAAAAATAGAVPLSPASASGLKRSGSPVGTRSGSGGASSSGAMGMSSPLRSMPIRPGGMMGGAPLSPLSPLAPPQPKPFVNGAPRPVGDDEFLSSEDDVVASAMGAYPSVNARLMEMSSVSVSLLMPPTAAAVASLPYSTEPPGPFTYATLQANAAAAKKTKWFTMNSGAEPTAAEAQAAQAAAMAGAEAAARAVAQTPFVSPPVLPRPYSAASVVIVVELPPHLYRLLPACLREIEPKYATGSANNSADKTGAGSQSTSAPRPLTHIRQSTQPSPSNPSPLSGSVPSGDELTSRSAPDASSEELSLNAATKLGVPVASSPPPPSTSPAPGSTGSTAAAPIFAPVVTSMDGEAVALSTPLIDVWPVLVTQGVNELQTMANMANKNDLQQDVNLYALNVLQAYHMCFARDQRAALERAQASSKERLRVSSALGSLRRDLQSMELMVYSFNAEKNIQLLLLTADLVKRMGGGRIVCCKSAKDRTSMSVTWEQARILYEQHGLSEHDVQSALNLMRTEGVRKLNVIKNTGQSAYAFNVIQRSFLPPIFRPPENACSSSIDG